MYKKTYLDLTSKEIAEYTQSMYNYSSISYELFNSIFAKKYDWNLFGNLYQNCINESNQTPEGNCVKEFYDHSYKTLNNISWIMSKSEQKDLLKNMKVQKISEERIQQYVKGFPYISAILVYVGSTKLYGFYPYNGV